MSTNSATSKRWPTGQSFHYLHCTTSRHRPARDTPQPAARPPGRRGPTPALCKTATEAADQILTVAANRLLSVHVLGPHRERIPALCMRLAGRQSDQPTAQSLTEAAKLNIDLATTPRGHLRQFLDAFDVQIEHDCLSGTARIHAKISSALHVPTPPPARILPTITAVEISQIQTTPMTPEEYHTAVEALAVLIRRWWPTTST